MRNSFSHSFSSLFLYYADFCSVFARADLLTAEVESRTQGSRPRPRTQKTSEAKDSLSEDRHSRGQGQPFRGQTLSRPRTGMLETKAKNQGHKRKCSPKKKKILSKIYKRSPQKNVFQKIFQPLHEILTIQKIVLSSSQGQANF